MNKPTVASGIFVGALALFVYALYLIFGSWLSSARHADQLFDEHITQTEKHRIAEVIAVTKITDVGGFKVAETVVTYSDFNDHPQKITDTQHGDSLVLRYGINVFKDGHTEFAGGLPGSHHFLPPIVVGIVVSFAGGLGLLGLGVVTSEEWSGYFASLKLQQRREREDREAEARRLARELELTPLQRDAELRIKEAEALPDTVADKADLVRRARAAAEALSRPGTEQSDRLRIELDVLEQAIKQS